MPIQSLVIQDFRCFRAVDLSLGRGMNFFQGANAAGKTSLIEAIYVLGRGRSFRGGELKRVVREGASSASAISRLGDFAVNRSVVLGAEIRDGTWNARLDGGEVTRRMDVLRALPLLLLCPGTLQLVEGGAEFRRVFLDYLLFHVEPDYAEWLSRFRRLLKQRNEALRSGQIGVARAFSAAFVADAERLTACRRTAVERLGATLAGSVFLPPWLAEVELRFQPGQPVRATLGEELERRLTRDRVLGYTSVGPQRADLELRVAGHGARERLSRGQQKLLAYLLVIAQACLVGDRLGCAPLLLVDDLGAELDAGHRQGVLASLRALRAQTLVTSVEGLDDAEASPDDRRFHVEQGCIHDLD